MPFAVYCWTDIANCAEEAVAWCEQRSTLSWEEFSKVNSAEQPILFNFSCHAWQNRPRAITQDLNNEELGRVFKSMWEQCG